MDSIDIFASDGPWSPCYLPRGRSMLDQEMG